ncbi:MAG: MiaB/RimO family radical SAM methylthiotransferase [Leptospiraceae bacterium]|nr:MiaB/RimO family radical SAM methylthiotransferase [Leptospiraceae bacterium]MDW8306276.1 MiaB/RimO family radical SAM methylthiotransferase [Leptospiraceae bacterium]
MVKASDLSFYIETLGCPKNEVDSRRMRHALLEAGFREAAKPLEADFLLINSCSFIREAQEETIEKTFHALSLKGRSQKLKVGLVGCFVERFHKEVREEIPELDFLLGTGRYHEIPYLLSRKFQIKLSPHAAENFALKAVKNEKPYAFIRLSEGCNRKCSFCVIPKIRGKFTPYNLEEIKRQWSEEKALRRGQAIREVVLVSQDTISQKLYDIEAIIDYFSKIDEVHWIRLHYLFPDRRVLDLLELFPKYPKLVSYLDMPIQHASERILARMKRPQDMGLIDDIISHARKMRPNLEIRTSFIVGFPGEEDSDFQQLFHFLEKHKIEKLALFRYSHETHSKAFELYRDDIPEKVKIERMNELMRFHEQMRETLRQKLIGGRATIIIDSINKREVHGRREQDSPEIEETVILDRRELGKELRVGDLCEVEITDFVGFDFLASVPKKETSHSV